MHGIPSRFIVRAFLYEPLRMDGFLARSLASGWLAFGLHFISILGFLNKSRGKERKGKDLLSLVYETNSTSSIPSSSRTSVLLSHSNPIPWDW